MEIIDIVRKIFEDEKDVVIEKGDKDNDILIIIEGCPIKKTFYCSNYDFGRSINDIEKYINDCRVLVRKKDDKMLSYNEAIAYIEWQSTIHSIKIYASYDKNIIFNKLDKGYLVVNIDNIVLTKEFIDCFFVGIIEDFDNENYIKDFDAIYMDVPDYPLNSNYLSSEYPVAGKNKKFYYYWIKSNGQKRYITKSNFDCLRHLYFMKDKDIIDNLRHSIMHGMLGNFSVTKNKNVCLPDECTAYQVTSKLGHGVGGFIAFLECFRSIFGEIHIEDISNKEVYFYVKN